MDGKDVTWPEQTLGQVLARQAGERGTAEALVTQGGRFTYRRLFAMAREAAGSLQALGIRKGDHVGILMGNDEHWLSLFYGAALIGAVTVPVNTRFKSAEIAFCLKQADCKLLVYAERFLGPALAGLAREHLAQRLLRPAHVFPIH
jgi:fatty-acyl-CoA synthase